MAKKSEQKTQTDVISADDVLSAYTHNTRHEHSNFLDTVYYKVSTGSLLLDAALQGGISPGVVRLVGFNQGGKTPEALEMMRNFFKVQPKGRGIYFKAEGRLSPETIARSGVPFVFKEPKDNWKPGTCFVYEGNIFENILGAIQALILNNPEKTPFFFIIDSLDGVILRQDVGKSLEDAVKVAGPQVIMKLFFKQASQYIQKLGHIFVLISQVSANVSIDQRNPAPVRQISGTGGNAALHWADIIIDYLPQFNSHLILENQNEKYNEDKNKIIGHLCSIEIKKSANEAKGQRFTYPIKHGRVNGNSIWRELEISDYMLGNDLLNRAGAWYTIEDSYLQEIKARGVDIKEKFQGIDYFHKVLEDNPALTDYLFKTFCDNIIATNSLNVVDSAAQPLLEEEHEAPKA